MSSKLSPQIIEERKTKIRTMSKASGSGSSGSEMHQCGLPVAGIMERDAKISVWIDLESCPVPSRRVSNLGCHIVDALRGLGYCSEDISIKAYADINRIPENHTKALRQNGITLSYVERIEQKMLEDFGIWAQTNEPPVNLLIVSGDTGFWPTMKTLRNYKYNIMMACRPSKYGNYPPADTVMCWDQLVLGNLHPAQIELYQ